MGFNIPQVLSKATLQVSLNCLSFRLAFVVLSPKGFCCKVLKDGASGKHISPTLVNLFNQTRVLKKEGTFHPYDLG